MCARVFTRPRSQAHAQQTLPPTAACAAPLRVGTDNAFLPSSATLRDAPDKASDSEQKATEPYAASTVVACLMVTGPLVFLHCSARVFALFRAPLEQLQVLHGVVCEHFSASGLRGFKSIPYLSVFCCSGWPGLGCACRLSRNLLTGPEFRRRLLLVPTCASPGPHSLQGTE